MKQADKTKTPKSKKVAKDMVISRFRTGGSPRKVVITLSKDQLEPKDVWPYMGITIQTALRELGVGIDITVREDEKSYQVVAEE